MPSMNTITSIRIGCASAFWGDTTTAARQLIEKGNLDFLVFDYLAEVTLAIMAGQKLKDPQAGYAKDFIRDAIVPNLQSICNQNIKIIANAGGINPEACGTALSNAIQQTKEKLNRTLKVAIVTGDNLMNMASSLKEFDLHDLQDRSPLPPFLITMNAYTGSAGIIKALQEDADIIITGRVADSALTLAPALYSFGWRTDNYNALSQASLAGHIIECGAQATGGNFTDWHKVPHPENIGFPIVEIYENGDFIVTKPEATGGLINKFTIAEQLVYEIDNPQSYQLPDVICDWSNVQLQETTDGVSVTNAKGLPPSGLYKIAATYPEGYKVSSAFLIYGYNSHQKAIHVAQSIEKKVSQLFKEKQWPPFTHFQFDCIGANATSGRYNPQQNSAQEIVLKVSALHPLKEALILLSRELAQVSTSNAPGICPLTNGRPNVHPRIKLFTSLIPAQLIEEKLFIHTEELKVNNPFFRASELTTGAFKPPKDMKQSSIKPFEEATSLEKVLLNDICCARSGDKGNNANIGIIARHPLLWEDLKKSITPDFISQIFSPFLDETQGRVEIWELPGIHALNIVLHHSLGSGGFSSTRLDTQGKGYAQFLLSQFVYISSKTYAAFKLEKQNLDKDTPSLGQGSQLTEEQI